MTLAILADDLTGAADCAARCRGAGLPATIVLRQPSATEALSPLPSGVVALTSDSRHLPPGLAAERVRELVAGLGHIPNITWYKKIDSTLRGNLGAELDAMLDALGRDCALICPAFPAQGRGLSGGQLVSAAARPIDLPAQLEQQSRRAVATIRLNDVRSSAAHLAEQLAAAGAGPRLLVMDALTDDDLGNILDAAALALPDALLCGSAGLIGALAARWRESELRADAPETIPLRSGARALLVVGSGSAAARRQIAYLRQYHQIETIEVDLAANISDEERRSQVTGRRLRSEVQPEGPQVADDTPHTTGSTVLGSRFSALRDVLLHLPEPHPHATLEGREARLLAGWLARAAVDKIAQLRPALLVLVGGDAATHVLSRLGVERLEVLCELLPGISLACGDAEGHQRLVILKAGNHGDDATLVTLLRLVRNEE